VCKSYFFLIALIIIVTAKPSKNPILKYGSRKKEYDLINKGIVIIEFKINSTTTKIIPRRKPCFNPALALLILVRNLQLL